MTSMGTRSATTRDIDRVTECITLAFATDPVWEPALRRDDGRTDHLESYWRLFVEDAVEQGSVSMTTDGEAVAVWIPPGAENYVAKRDCPPEGCAVDTIEYAIGVLSDDAHPEAKLLALKYLVHLVGDIHQPFHAMEAKGYLMAGTKQTTLHRAWDSIVVAYPKLKGPEIAALIDRTEAAPNLKGDAEDWAWESHVIARDIILPRAELFRRAKPAILPPDYAKESWPIAAARLKAAGMRLAWTLNDIYAPGGRAHSR